MANEQNLKPGEYKLTVEQAKKGGIASGKARKQKASFKKAIKWLAESDIKITYEKKMMRIIRRRI